MAVLLCVLSVSILIAAPASLLMSQRPVGVGPALLIAADPADVAIASGVEILGPVAAPFAVFVAVASAERMQALRQNGAWFILDGRIVSFVCGQSR